MTEIGPSFNFTSFDGISNALLGVHKLIEEEQVDKAYEVAKSIFNNESFKNYVKGEQAKGYRISDTHYQDPIYSEIALKYFKKGENEKAGKIILDEIGETKNLAKIIRQLARLEGENLEAAEKLYHARQHVLKDHEGEVLFSICWRYAQNIKTVGKSLLLVKNSEKRYKVYQVAAMTYATEGKVDEVMAIVKNNEFLSKDADTLFDDNSVSLQLLAGTLREKRYLKEAREIAEMIPNEYLRGQAYKLILPPDAPPAPFPKLPSK